LVIGQDSSQYHLPELRDRQDLLDLFLSLFPDETEKWQSRFQQERKEKEADCIIAERSCRFFIVFLLAKILRIL